MKAFDLAYYQNKSFRSRKHEPINVLGPDGKPYTEDGTASIKLSRLDKQPLQSRNQPFLFKQKFGMLPIWPTIHHLPAN